MKLPRILIVEDEPAIADNIVYALKTEGFAPHWCRTGEQALADFVREPPALVILDIGLPDISGFDLCRKLRALAPTPIIFLSARDSEIDKVLGLELGGDDYMVKPFSPRELSARVRARLRRLSPLSPEAGGLEHRESEQSILLDGQALDLTRYEYRLLAILLAQPRRVYSRDQLLEQAWSDPAASFDRTVDTHIKTLRQKIRQHRPQANPIRTHRGIGYSYEPDGL